MGSKSANLGQHRMAVSPGSRADMKTSSNGTDGLNAPEVLVDIGLSLAAAPTVAQPEGQTSPGE